MVMKLVRSTGAHEYTTGVYSPDGIGNKRVAALNVNEGDDNNIATCGENMGTSTFDLTIILYRKGTFDLIRSEPKHYWRIDSLTQLRCSSIKVINQFVNLVIYDEGSHFLFAKFDTAGDPGDITFTKVKVGSNAGNLPYATSVLTGGAD